MAWDARRWSRFAIPVFFFAGRHDFDTPGALAAAYLDVIEAPAKGMFWFEQSGHSPPWEEPEMFRRRLMDVLRVAEDLTDQNR